MIAEDFTLFVPEFAGLIPREVDKVLRRVFSKKREDRYPTINAFARAFEAAAGAAPARPAAAPARAPQQSRRPQPKRTGLWISVAFVVLLAAAAAAWMFRVEITSSEWWPEELPRATGAQPAGGSKLAPDDGAHRRKSSPRPR